MYPSASGVATIYDKEIVFYIASLMAAKIEGGEGEGGFFSWLSEANLHYSCVERSERRLKAGLCNWLFRATSKKGAVRADGEMTS